MGNCVLEDICIPNTIEEDLAAKTNDLLAAAHFLIYCALEEIRIKINVGVNLSVVNAAHCTYMFEEAIGMAG